MKKHIILPILWMRKLKLKRFRNLLNIAQLVSGKLKDLNLEHVLSEPV